MRRRVYGMGGVQSVPRVMRSLPVTRPVMFDTSLKSAGRTMEIYHQQGRLGSLGGLTSQGLARTLGTLGGCTLGDEDVSSYVIVRKKRR